MKFNTSLALFVLVGLVACSNALPARKRMAYYRQPASYYSAPQRMMYMQYVQPSYGNGRSSQAASALVAGETVATGTYLQETDAAAAAAGPGVSFSAESSEDAFGAAGAHVAHSVAEAYPTEDKKIAVKVGVGAQDKGVTVEVPSSGFASSAESDDSAKEGRQYYYGSPAGSTDVEINLSAGESDAGLAKGVDANGSFDTAETADVASTGTVSVGFSGSAESEAPAYGGAGSASKGFDVSVNLPAPAPIAPVAKPARRYLPGQKKVIVELEQSAESDADNAVAVQDDDDADVDEDDQTDVTVHVPVAPKVPARRRPAAKKPGKAANGCAACAKAGAGCAGCSKAAKPLPAGTFFPVDFGGATGGAIAIANSFSTGEGGAATSHAIAYGSPEQARAHVRPNRRH